MSVKVESGDAVALNNQKYIVNIFLVNSKGALKLPIGVVQQLVITDSLYSVFSYGKLVINSSHNTIDNFSMEQLTALKDTVGDAAYMFNSDSRDNVIINILPIDGRGETVFPPKSSWEMFYIFSIYDEDETVTGNNNIKSKIFFLRDIREQTLRETNTHWSTVIPFLEKYPHKINISHASDNLLQVNTGDAIANLLQTVLEKKESDAKLKFGVDWDQGSSKIFYTSNSNSSAFDDLEYLLDNYVSSTDNDNCILRLERSGQFSLLPLHIYFTRAVNKDNETEYIGEQVIDIFTVASASIPTATESTETAPIGEGKTTFTIPSQLLDYVIGITSYDYLNQSNDDSLSELVTTAVHTYSYKDKQFSTAMPNVTATKDTLQRLYADKMAGSKPTVIFPVNDEKTRNNIIENIYSTRGTTSAKSGINKILGKALAYSPGISFNVDGATNREAGKFAVFMTPEVRQGTPFAKTFLGEWLMIRVEHIFLFDNNEYLNNVSCIKPHTSEPLVIEEE